MRKVQIVRRPVVLSLGAHPKSALPASEPALSVDDTVEMDVADTLDVAHPAGSGAFDALDDDDADLDDEPTVVTAIAPAIATSRTSTSTVSASKRLEVIKQSRARKA